MSDIKLPPLPKAAVTRMEGFTDSGTDYWAASQIQYYARQCVLADRAARAELREVPTPNMLNAAVDAWHAWKTRDNGGSVQALGALMWEYMNAVLPTQERGADDANS